MNSWTFGSGAWGSGLSSRQKYHIAGIVIGAKYFFKCLIDTCGSSIFFFKPLNAFIFNFFWTLSFPLYKKVLVVPSPPPSPSARSVPAARALLLPLKSGNKYQKKWHQVFMLSDGTKWASETCQAGRYWVWITSRCRRECGGLLLWSLSLGAGTVLRPPATCPGRCPGLGCLPSGLCACASPPPLDWGGWCC